MAKKDISRRQFLKIFGGGAMTAAAIVTCCKSKTEQQALNEYAKQVEPPVGKMTFRTNPSTGDKVSLLGYGMMRLPSKTENQDDYDQEMINKQVDYAIEHGVNYFDIVRESRRLVRASPSVATSVVSISLPPNFPISIPIPKLVREALPCTRNP